MRTVGRSGVFRQPVYKQWQRLGQERKSKKNEAVPQLTNSSSFNEGDHEKKKKLDGDINVSYVRVSAVSIAKCTLNY